MVKWLEVTHWDWVTKWLPCLMRVADDAMIGEIVDCECKLINMDVQLFDLCSKKSIKKEKISASKQILKDSEIEHLIDFQAKVCSVHTWLSISCHDKTVWRKTPRIRWELVWLVLISLTSLSIFFFPFWNYDSSLYLEWKRYQTWAMSWDCARCHDFFLTIKIYGTDILCSQCVGELIVSCCARGHPHIYMVSTMG